MNSSDFYKRITIIGNYIPKGKVVSYGQIALLCGRPNHARQVGYALNRKKAGENFPAHRVVNGQGYLSGAASFAAADTQRKLLEKEGVRVSEEARVDLKTYGWHHTLDDAEMLYHVFEKYHI